MVYRKFHDKEIGVKFVLNRRESGGYEVYLKYAFHKLKYYVYDRFLFVCLNNVFFAVFI